MRTSRNINTEIPVQKKPTRLNHDKSVNIAILIEKALNVRRNVFSLGFFFNLNMYRCHCQNSLYLRKEF